jgi:REase_MTES_1575
LHQTSWEIHQQAGCAQYRIDMGVVDPEASGRYLLGIECDDANHHRAKTERDRDKLKDGILQKGAARRDATAITLQVS